MGVGESDPVRWMEEGGIDCCLFRFSFWDLFFYCCCFLGIGLFEKVREEDQFFSTKFELFPSFQILSIIGPDPGRWWNRIEWNL